MRWERDDARLDRVRALMSEQDLDAVVVRAPDNVVYLANYWSMKGFDLLVFPRAGDPALVVIEPQAPDAERTAWTRDVRTFPFYDERDPRPPAVRAIDRALEVLREQDLVGRVGLELNQGTQGADRMVGEPTTPTRAYFDAFADVAREVVDASGLLAAARMLKTDQEIERMRLANELAGLGLAHVEERLRPGMLESEVAALFDGHVHSIGVGYEGRVDMARAFTLVWSGPSIQPFAATGNRPVLEDAPTLMEIWVCADGYWTDLTKNLCPGRLSPRYEALLDTLLEVYGAAVDAARDGADLGLIDRLIRERTADVGYPGQPRHPVCHGVGARAHEPPFAHQAAPGKIQAGMVLAIEPGIYWDGGGGLRLEDDFLIGSGAPEALCGFPADFRSLD